MIAKKVAEGIRSPENTGKDQSEVMDKRLYQYGFSEQNPLTMYNIEQRSRKADKVLAVLATEIKDLSNMSLLDIGCSTGIMTAKYGEKFSRVTGVDIDKPAIEHAINTYSAENVRFCLKDGMETLFDSTSFDVVICTHIYEHVPDSRKLLTEIYRLLKPGGYCYFVAANRFTFLEGHYHLPFLSVVPKTVAHLYLKMTGKGKYYYEKHLTYWKLKKLVSEFEIIDYTGKIVEDPVTYHAEDMIKPGSWKQKLALYVIREAYWAFPTYVWLLHKK
ncbi:MAG: methyltransferase domain-containing protein [Candidatus Cloacimonetes bacterium]|nr:methyltransferase domain-containing protein [Candidatus Cloacimonadota bacterium]